MNEEVNTVWKDGILTIKKNWKDGRRSGFGTMTLTKENANKLKELI